MTLLTKILAGIIIIFAGIMVYGFIRIDNLLATIEHKQDVIEEHIQNTEALVNQLTMKDSSLQDFAVFVENLQTDVEGGKEKFRLLNQEYQVLVNSVSVSDSETIVIIGDSVITVKFDGKEGKVSYEGNTKYFVETEEGTYSIEIIVDSTKIHSKVYIDSSDIIRNEIYADGVLLADAKTNIDSSLFHLIKDAKFRKIRERNVFDRIGIFGEINYGNVGGKLYLGGGAYYEINDNISISISKYIDTPDWFLTASYYMSVRDIFSGN